MPDWLLAVLAEAIAVVLASAVLAALGWVVGAVRDLRNEIKGMASGFDARLDKAETRLVLVEEMERQEVIRRLGDVEVNLAALEARCLREGALSEIHQRVDGLTKEVHSLGGKFEGAARSLEMIHSHLLDKGQPS
ncbi:MAG: hypothetical protein F4Y47_00140 [Acidobacteriia bacterium]|nr:hypothetical protein [Terriglobia bacterium]MYG04426.1 hypothetical protein [Terriglobia bacterium]MYK11291.1 hypothetical protein [Terriglobia bacterium]